jgi:uncharacterized protein
MSTISPELTPIGCKTPVAQSLPLAVKKLVRTLQPEKIILFGSYAYGQPTPDSDVDLLVIMETDKQGSERSWQVAQLLIPRPFPVDILVRTPQELKAGLEKGDCFLQEIVTKGQVLYERPH